MLRKSCKDLDFLWLLIACCCPAGCDRGDLPDLAIVTGVVTLDGQPLVNKEVTFAPATEGRPSNGRTNDSGEYELRYAVEVSGAIIGKHTVRISTPLPEGGDYTGFKETIPAKFNQKSELKAEVTAGKNRLNFELKSN